MKAIEVGAKLCLAQQAGKHLAQAQDADMAPELVRAHIRAAHDLVARLTRSLAEARLVASGSEQLIAIPNDGGQFLPCFAIGIHAAPAGVVA